MEHGHALELNSKTEYMTILLCDNCQGHPRKSDRVEINRFPIYKREVGIIKTSFLPRKHSQMLSLRVCVNKLIGRQRSSNKIKDALTELHGIGMACTDVHLAIICFDSNYIIVLIDLYR